MEVNSTQNILNYSIELSDPLNPIIIEDIKYFPINEVLNLVVEQLLIEGEVQDLEDYNISIAITDPDGEVFINNSQLMKLGLYYFTISIENKADSSIVSMVSTFECVNAIQITTEDCTTFTINNHNVFPVNLEIVDALTEEVIVEQQEIPAQTAFEFDIEDVNIYRVNINYGDRPPVTEYYIINSYCKLEQCVTRYITSLLCDESIPCQECPPAIELNRLMGLNYLLTAKLNNLYGKNNFYSSLETIPALEDIKSIMDKIKDYCSRIDCIGTAPTTYGLTNNTSGCGCGCSK